MIAALLCIIGGAIIGAAIGYALAESELAPELDETKAALGKACAQRDAARAQRDDALADVARWRAVANKLHDENDAHREFLAPIFRTRGN